MLLIKVHEAAKLLGVTPRTLRFYEEKGLLKPRKEQENGYRTYSEENLTQLRWIVALRELGLPITAIADALAAFGQHTFVRKIDEARAGLYAEWVEAGRRLQALDETIAVWQKQNLPELAQAEELAVRFKQSRLDRSSWSDIWRYDELALIYGKDAPLAALSNDLTPEQYDDALLRTVEWLDPRSSEHGLELGAGTGNLSALLAATGAKLTAVEQSQEMLAVLRSRLPEVEPRLGNLLAIPTAGPSFHFIACSFAMRHLDRNQQLLALAEADRVLLPAGRIAFTDRFSYELPLFDWLADRNYSIVTESLDSDLTLLYGVKPNP